MRVVWATNVAAPYRLPVWEALSRRVDLEIWLLAANEHNRRWSTPAAEEYDVRVLRTVGQRRRESVQYTLTQRLGHLEPRPDVLILPGWDSPAAWQLMSWAKRRKVTTLAFNESTMESHRHRHGPVDRARGWFFRHADGVLTVSPGSTEAVLAVGVSARKVTQLVNAVDVHMIHREAERIPRLSDSVPHTYLFLGQLIERKRPDLVIEALTHLGDSRLLIAGEGRMLSHLHDLVSRMGLQGRVEFLGYIDPKEVPAVLGRCDTLVLPSQREVYGLAVIEALAAGLHVVVSERAGVAGAVRSVKAAWTVEPSLNAVVSGMRASAEAWSGPTTASEMLRHAPDAMAASIAVAASTAAYAK